MLESLRKQIQELEADIEELKEKISARDTVAAQKKARLFLENIFAPYMDAICLEWDVSPEEALRILIDEKTTFGKIATDNPKELEKLKNEPAVKLALNVASPLGKVSDEWIKDKMSMLLEVMEKIRPSMANAITTTPGGTEWFYDSLVGLRNILYGIPQL